MTPEECIDLVTPEADRQPRTRCSALPSHAATVTLSFDLTTDTPLPVSARGIAGDDNDRHGGDAHHDSDRPPDLPRLYETRENARSNTSHALVPVTAPVTNSSSSPRKKKSRSSRRRYSGKENSSSSDDFSFDSPLVENRKFPFWTKLTPRGSDTLSPALHDLAGKTPLSHHQCLAGILTHYQSLAWILSDSLSWRERTHYVGPEKFPAF